MAQPTRNNYEIAKKDAGRAFCAYDHESIARKWGLSLDDEWLHLTFMQHPCRVSRATGTVFSQVEGEWREADFNAAMTIYDLLGYAKEGAYPAGRVANMRSLHLGAASIAPSPQNFFARQVTVFESHRDQLPEAFSQMGATPIAGGDLAFRLDVFQGLTLDMQYWNADDDFPATIELFWDENVLDYMHYETVWYAVGCVLKTIIDLLEGHER